MSASAQTAFNSVKLPSQLVSEAKQAAITMRRSTAGQIEYWVMLGKAVEAGGLTVREAAQALESTQGAQSVQEKAPLGKALPDQADQLLSQFTQFEASGALAQHMRKVISAQAARASQVTSG
jgi:hypothetical protein